MAVDKAGVVELHALLKQYKFFGFCNAEDITDEGEPKGLAVALFVAALFPVFREGFRRFFLSVSVMVLLLALFFYNVIITQMR